jgi:hypothetical protein
MAAAELFGVMFYNFSLNHIDDVFGYIGCVAANPLQGETAFLPLERGYPAPFPGCSG